MPHTQSLEVKELATPAARAVGNEPAASLQVPIVLTNSFCCMRRRRSHQLFAFCSLHGEPSLRRVNRGRQ